MGKKILVIDDDPDILDVVKLILIEGGFQPILRQTGAQASEIVVLDPGLILMDVRIKGYPSLGTEICAQIKSESTMANVPILLFSSEDGLAELAANSGADGYIRKPFDIQVLLGKIREFVS